MLEDHRLSPRPAQFMPENRIPELADAFDELLGVHPSIWSLVQHTTETILALAHRGHAILIGRGAHIITRKLEHIFHVRLVGSLAKRVAHIEEVRTLGKREALDLVQWEDRGRQRYLKKYFGRDIEDPESYHLVINTDFMPYEKAGQFIADAALDHFRASGSRGPASYSAPRKTQV